MKFIRLHEIDTNDEASPLKNHPKPCHVHRLDETDPRLSSPRSSLRALTPNRKSHMHGLSAHREKQLLEETSKWVTCSRPRLSLGATNPNRKLHMHGLSACREKQLLEETGKRVNSSRRGRKGYFLRKSLDEYNSCTSSEDDEMEWSIHKMVEESFSEESFNDSVKGVNYNSGSAEKLRLANSLTNQSWKPTHSDDSRCSILTANLCSDYGWSEDDIGNWSGSESNTSSVGKSWSYVSSKKDSGSGGYLKNESLEEISMDRLKLQDVNDTNKFDSSDSDCEPDLSEILHNVQDAGMEYVHHVHALWVEINKIGEDNTKRYIKKKGLSEVTRNMLKQMNNSLPCPNGVKPASGKKYRNRREYKAEKVYRSTNNQHTSCIEPRNGVRFLKNVGPQRRSGILLPDFSSGNHELFTGIIRDRYSSEDAYDELSETSMMSGIL